MARQIHFAREFRLAAFLAVPLLLVGCGTLPNNGPVGSEVIESSANKGKSGEAKPAYVFDVIEVTPENAEVAASYKPSIFNSTFGLGKGSVSPTIGVGDTLQITVFEAGPDGVFSTVDNKSTQFTVTVQPDGMASIPYVGQVKFSGRSVESARSDIVSRLKSKAVEPDVIVNLAENGSRTVSVNGEVGKPSIVPLGLRPQKVLDVLALAGGPRGAPYETSVTLTRGGKTGTVLLQTIVRHDSENIYTRSGDQFFVGKEPQSFTALGSNTKSAKIAFEDDSVNLVEAVALAGGSNVTIADPSNYFIFRYEYAGAIKKIIGEERFRQLSEAGIRPNERGMYPLVYRIDMRKPENYLIGQSFRLRNKDVLYLSRHPAADFIKFMQMVSTGVNVARGIQSFD